MSRRRWTSIAGMMLVVMLPCAACGGGSTSSVTLPQPGTSNRSGTPRPTSRQGGLVGRCWMVSAQVFRTKVDHSRPVPCSHAHNVETAGVHPVYSKLTKANTSATVDGYGGECGPDYQSYLHASDAPFIRLWGSPLAMKRSDGSWVVRCDVYVQTRMQLGGPAAVTRTSLRAQARSGHTADWSICTDLPPKAHVPLVDCSRPHQYEGVPTYQTITALQGVYPSSADLRTRGTAACRHAIRHRADSARLGVTGSWTSRRDWINAARPSYIPGSCFFWRRDHQDLPAEH